MADGKPSAPRNRAHVVTPIRVAKQLLPPLLLLPLFNMPFEVFTSLFWLAGGVAVLISLLTLARTAWARLQGRRPDWLDTLRPGLTVLLFGASAVTMYSTSAALAHEVDSLGRAVAKEMQESCSQNRKCPMAPSGWEADQGRARKVVKFMSVQYSTNADGSEFVVRVRHRMEDELLIHGGVSRPLREEISLR